MSFDFLLKDYPQLATSVGSVTRIKTDKRIAPKKLPDLPHPLKLPNYLIAPAKIDDDSKREINERLKNILPRELRTITLDYLTKGMITATKRKLLKVTIIDPCNWICDLLKTRDSHTFLIAPGLIVELSGNLQTREKLQSVVDYVSKLTSCDALKPENGWNGSSHCGDTPEETRQSDGEISLTVCNDNICIRVRCVWCQSAIEPWKRLLKRLTSSSYKTERDSLEDKFKEAITRALSLEKDHNRFFHQGKNTCVKYEITMDNIFPPTNVPETAGQMVWGDHWFDVWNEEELQQRFGYPIDKISVIDVIFQTAKIKPPLTKKLLSSLHFFLEDQWERRSIYFPPPIRWKCSKEGTWNLEIEHRCRVTLYGELMTPQLYRLLATMSQKYKNGLQEYAVFRQFTGYYMGDTLWILAIPAKLLRPLFPGKDKLWLQVIQYSGPEGVTEITAAESSNKLWQLLNLRDRLELLRALDRHLTDKFHNDCTMEAFDLLSCLNEH